MVSLKLCFEIGVMSEEWNVGCICDKGRWFWGCLGFVSEGLIDEIFKVSVLV